MLPIAQALLRRTEASGSGGGSGSDGFNPSPNIGGVGGGVICAALLIISLLGFYIRKRRRRRAITPVANSQDSDRNDGPVVRESSVSIQPNGFPHPDLEGALDEAVENGTETPAMPGDSHTSQEGVFTDLGERDDEAFGRHHEPQDDQSTQVTVTEVIELLPVYTVE